MEILTRTEAMEQFQQLQNSIESLSKKISDSSKVKVGVEFYNSEKMSEKLGVSKPTLMNYIRNNNLKQKGFVKNINILNYKKEGRDWIFSVKVG